MKLEEYTISWSQWLFALVAVILLYFVLVLLANVLDRVNVLGKRQRRVAEILQVILHLYEPMAVLFLLVGFIFINLFLHGLLAAFVLMLSFYPVKNYVNGRLFLLSNQLQEGQRIRVNENSGIIRKLGRQGVSLQTKKGIQYVNYNYLQSHGYLLLKGEQIGRLHQLLISPDASVDTLSIPVLKNKFFSCPYIDWSLKPEIKISEKNNSGYRAQILLREEEHLSALTELIREWGYGCEVLS